MTFLATALGNQSSRVSWEQMVRELTLASHYWVTLTFPDGRPYARTTGGVWLKETRTLAVYLHLEAAQLHGLNKQPFSSVNLESSETAIVIQGVATLVTDPAPALVSQVAQAYRAKYNALAMEPVQTSETARRVLCLIRPHQIEAWFNDQNFSRPTRWSFSKDGIISSSLPTEAVIAPEPAESEAASKPTPPQQPTDPANPGSNFYPYPQISQDSWERWHYDKKCGASWPTQVQVFSPVTDKPPAQGFPVLAMSPGKTLNLTFYRELVQHIARKGYVVLFIITEASLLDCQHKRMAEEFLEAIKDAIQTGNHFPPGWIAAGQIGWWGHSMGSKVTAIAASMVDDSNYLQPAFVVGTAFTDANGAPIICDSSAMDHADKIPENVVYTLIPGSEDTIASYKESTELYKAMDHLKWSQVILVNGFALDNLVSDHAAPATANCMLPCWHCVFEFDLLNCSECGVVDALDWYGYWKWVVGALDYHFNNGVLDWAYGSQRLFGGTDSAGNTIQHMQLAQSWNESQPPPR